MTMGIQFRYRIVQTNTFTRHVPIRDQRTGEVRDVEHAFKAGRVIGEHNEPGTVKRHCERLRRDFPDMQFKTICGYE